MIGRERQQRQERADEEQRGMLEAERQRDRARVKQRLEAELGGLLPDARGAFAGKVLTPKWTDEMLAPVQTKAAGLGARSICT